MTRFPLYPLKFTPELKEKVWGGSQLVSCLNKEGQGVLGESWEISGVEGTISKVATGTLKGKQLTEIIADYKEALVGTSVYATYGNEFPLLFKFIDAQQDLSVQLHPNDILAKKRHNSFGKTEMWYVLKASGDARLILGFNKEVTKKQYAETLAAGQITSLLQSKKVSKGESFFIAPGTVHAIGAGVLLAEIQQTSDITYRIYDWDRPDTDGQLRQLHTEEALEAIDFKNQPSKIEYSDCENTRVLLKACPYFVTHKLQLTEDFVVSNFKENSFKVYMCVAGEASVLFEGEHVAIKKGETVLIPACCKHYVFETENATLLEVYIP
ncbi:mannose-6-phosphate isomerase [Rasiella rasia]|uniref:Phosphohexomutase n=1 Tax=Rasiella rasia TaxID=2744027 RepID=A0A6G6GMV7_9FLAO|nr:type I phosphomannose isomerase catalytic subunit [Rasiella rasia]QIE59031.1 mannose-6-phosphate isomerase [Rasiella rasia]